MVGGNIGLSDLRGLLPGEYGSTPQAQRSQQGKQQRQYDGARWQRCTDRHRFSIDCAQRYRGWSGECCADRAVYFSTPV